MHANIKVDHFSILEGEDLITYAAVQLITLIYVAVLFINGVKELLKMRSVGSALNNLHTCLQVTRHTLQVYNKHKCLLHTGVPPETPISLTFHVHFRLYTR